MTSQPQQFHSTRTWEERFPWAVARGIATGVEFDPAPRPDDPDDLRYRVWSPGGTDQYTVGQQSGCTCPGWINTTLCKHYALLLSIVDPDLDPDLLPGQGAIATCQREESERQAQRVFRDQEKARRAAEHAETARTSLMHRQLDMVRNNERPGVAEARRRIAVDQAAGLRAADI